MGCQCDTEAGDPMIRSPFNLKKLDRLQYPESSSVIWSGIGQSKCHLKLGLWWIIVDSRLPKVEIFP
jgi:hypothetical protein